MCVYFMYVIENLNFFIIYRTLITCISIVHVIHVVVVVIIANIHNNNIKRLFRVN